jgi:hypothetical protein
VRVLHWYARPEGAALQLRKQPQVDQWEVTGHPGLTRVTEDLDDTEDLIGPARLEGPWALRLDVGLPPTVALLGAYDLDNYALPLTKRVSDPNLVSVWCTKAHADGSMVRLETARESASPHDIAVAKPTVPYDPVGPYKEQIHAAAAGLEPLPPDLPVRLELAFRVGPGRKWWNLWKPTIDGLFHLLGQCDRQQPLDGRITELGLHLSVDPAAGHAVTIGIAASCPSAPGMIQA